MTNNEYHEPPTRRSDVPAILRAGLVCALVQRVADGAGVFAVGDWLGVGRVGAGGGACSASGRPGCGSLGTGRTLHRLFRSHGGCLALAVVHALATGRRLLHVPCSVVFPYTGPHARRLT